LGRDRRHRCNDRSGIVSVPQAKQAADAARKAAASGSFFLFFSMLIGAFIASAARAAGVSATTDNGLVSRAMLGVL
jgi:hypothetical protein